METEDLDPTYAYNDYRVNPDPPHQPLYLAGVLRHLRSAPNIVRVLDAGCGDGNFARSLGDAGFEVYGVDLSPSGIGIAKEGEAGTFALGSVYEDLLRPFPGVSAFDAIVSIETLEHLYSPRVFVTRAYRALRSGGLLVVTTPYWGYFKNVALAVSGRMDGLFTALWDGGHIKHWSRRTLTQLVTEQGFEFVAFAGAGRRPPYLWRGMMLVFRKPL